MRADAREQLAGRERLDEVVVGARVEAFDARLFAGARRQQHDRHVRRRGIGAQRREQPEAVEPRHHHVGEDEIRRVRRAAASAGLAVGDGFDAVVRREQVARRSHACPRCRRRARCARRKSSANRVLALGVAASSVASGPSACGSRRAASAAPPARTLARRCRWSGAAVARRAPAADAPCRTGCARVNVVPRPSSLATSIVPPCSLTSSWTSARPMPEPSCVRPSRAVDAMEALEQARQLVLGHADAGVRDSQHGAVAVARAGVSETPPSKRELERVREQVEDDLFPHVAIDVTRGSSSGVAVDGEARARPAPSPSGTCSRGRA